MTILDTGAIRKKASDQLASAPYNPQKLALIYAGAALGISLVITVLDILLLQGIDTTGGLSGLGMRSVLETVRTVLRYILALALPFWGFGFLFTALAMARGGDNRPAGLLEGFRRFGPVLRLQLLQGVLYFGVGLFCVYVGSFLFYLTPLASDMISLLEPFIMEGGTPEQIEQAMAQIPMEQLTRAMWPALAMSSILCVVVLIPLHYRLRMARFFVMDEPKMGAMLAMIASSRYMRKNRLKWFRLDLSYWWYYAGLLLAALVCYGDMLLPRIGMEMPMSGDAAWLLFYALGALVQFVLDWCFRSRVQTAYALAYDILRQQEPYTPPVKPVPQKLPWDTYPTEE